MKTKTKAWLAAIAAGMVIPVLVSLPFLPETIWGTIGDYVGVVLFSFLAVMGSLYFASHAYYSVMKKVN